MKSKHTEFEAGLQQKGRIAAIAKKSMTVATIDGGDAEMCCVTRFSVVRCIAAVVCRIHVRYNSPLSEVT